MARWSLLVLAAALVIPTSAVATHMSSYAFYPTEHDDQGRSFEPDGQSTGVLGVNVENCIISPTLAPGCTPDSALPPPPAGQSNVLAPGCTDDAGRQPSGLCGLWNIGAGNANAGYGVGVPPGTVGTQGMSGTDAPGRFTPSKATKIRFLDSQAHAQLTPPAGGSTYLDLNSKLLDNGVRAALGGVDANLGSTFIAPLGNALWAWYGYWTDLNGNGVIDHLRGATECSTSTCPADGGVAANNEFVWIGRCVQFNGQAAPPGQRFCSNEADTTLPVWVYPGNHHAFCGFAVALGTPADALACGVTPGDAPGRVLTNYLLYTSCPSPSCLEELDLNDDQFQADPIFGQQDSRGVDQDFALGGIWGMGDRTGEPLITGRQWVYGLGWSTWFYDQSLLVSTVVVTGVSHEGPVEDLETDFDLTKLVASDVDNYRTWAPGAEDLLQGQVKPATRGAWLLAREVAAAEDATGEAGRVLPGTRLTWDQCDPFLGLECPGPVNVVGLGNTMARFFDPGWAKEPNLAGDSFPGAVRGSCTSAYDTYQGQCNTYAGYAAGPRGFFDVQQAAAYYNNLAWRPPNSNCLLCTTSGPTGLPDLGAGYLRDEGDRTRVIQPGSHVWFARIGAGAWTDKAQVHEEETLDLLATLSSLTPKFRTETYTVGPDGFLGDIVNATGFSRVGGFAPESCTVRGVTAVHEYAQCHPYGDGNFEYRDAEPNGNTYGEFDGAERFGGEGNLGHWLLRLRPADGCWSAPVLVWRAFDTWEIGNLAAIEDFTGRCEEITADMGAGPGMLTKDLFIFPQGSMGETVISTVSGTVTVVEAGNVIVRDFVRDVDEYGPWGG